MGNLINHWSQCICSSNSNYGGPGQGQVKGQVKGNASLHNTLSPMHVAPSPPATQAHPPPDQWPREHCKVRTLPLHLLSPFPYLSAVPGLPLTPPSSKCPLPIPQLMALREDSDKLIHTSMLPIKSKLIKERNNIQMMESWLPGRWVGGIFLVQKAKGDISKIPGSHSRQWLPLSPRRLYCWSWESHQMTAKGQLSSLFPCFPR